VTFHSALFGNLFSVLSGSSSVSRVLGTTNFTSINADSVPGDFATLNGKFGQNVSVNLGDGDNTFTVTPNAKFNASLTYSATNGDNQLNIGGLILNWLNLNLGNGDNNLTVTAQVNNQVVLTAGQGINTVNLDSANNVYSLNLLFGNGNNTVNLNGSDTIDGKIIGGTGVNNLNENGATLQPTFVTNFI
jgi:hypothetical protein